VTLYLLRNGDSTCSRYDAPSRFEGGIGEKPVLAEEGGGGGVEVGVERRYMSR